MPASKKPKPKPRRRPAEPPAEPMLLTALEAAVLLRLKPYQVRQKTRKGLITAVITGGTPHHPRGLRYTREALEAYRRALPTTEGGAA